MWLSAARRAGLFGRRARRGLRKVGRGHFKRKDLDRLNDVLELSGAKIGHSEIEPPLDLTIGVLH
jgi:hypothetical protein